MIYEAVGIDAPLTQGDIIDACPILTWEPLGADAKRLYEPVEASERVVVLTQACDLTQGKATRVAVCVVQSAEKLVAAGVLKGSVIRDQVRRHRVYGWYFLPAALNSRNPSWTCGTSTHYRGRFWRGRLSTASGCAGSSRRTASTSRSTSQLRIPGSLCRSRTIPSREGHG